jgi:hypothetical protein
MVARIWYTVARCARCGEPVTLLGNDFHHAGPADHAAALDLELGVEVNRELEGAEN